MNVVSAALNDLNEASSPELVKHQADLVRKTGSFVPGLLEWESTYDFLINLEWEEIGWEDLPKGAGIPIARYFRATGDGIRNTMSVAEARVHGLSLESRVHKPDPEGKTPNPRGLGVFTADKVDVQVPTQEIWIILGQVQGLVVPWTWHPGAPAVPVAKRHYRALDQGHWDDPVLQEVNVHLPQ